MDQPNDRISQTESIRFRTGAGMPSRLGSQQLRDETTAVLELVKNSYDADATTVRISFKEADGESILNIEDDGSYRGSTPPNAAEEARRIPTGTSALEFYGTAVECDRTVNPGKKVTGCRPIGPTHAIGSEAYSFA